MNWKGTMDVDARDCNPGRAKVDVRRCSGCWEGVGFVSEERCDSERVCIYVLLYL